MQDAQHIHILEQGVKSWNQWRANNQLILPRLRGANFSGADLRKVNLKQADLCGVNFSGADLSEAILNNANLSILPYQVRRTRLDGANLSRAVLKEANLYGAQLTGANLTQADLFLSNLHGATLIDANLIGTSLSWANLDETKLNGANVSQAIIEATKFNNVDLSAVIGLEAIRHYGPSTIGIDTIYRSKGNIPEIFLRGCGVPENFIIHMRSLVEGTQPIQFYSCFISYSHENKSFARRLHDTLQGQGIRCWLDEHQMLPGHDIFDEVDRGIRLWDKILLCCSKDSLRSWWVDSEINSAFAKEQQLTKERGQKVRALIPLNLDDYMFSGEWQNGKAKQIKSRLAADFTGWETDNKKFEEQFERLVKALRIDDGREQPPSPKL
jgi:hypothetical protein